MWRLEDYFRDLASFAPKIRAGEVAMTKSSLVSKVRSGPELVIWMLRSAPCVVTLTWYGVPHGSSNESTRNPF